MRKYAILLLLVFCLGSALTSCGDKGSGKVGIGVYTDLASDRSAIGGGDGHTKYVHTVAAIAEDRSGKIIACDIDSVEIKVDFSAYGEAKPADEYKSKGELGDEYGMKAAGAKLEWYQQRDAFCKAVIGKTVDEVKGLVGKDGKGNDSVIAAGCTVKIDEFVAAIVKADENAEPMAKSVSSLKVRLTTETEGKNASDAAPGSITSKTKIKIETDGADIKEKSADFEVWFNKAGILQPPPEAKAEHR